MAFRVELTAQARSDLSNIFDWLIEQDAGETGIRWFLRLEETCESLGALPHRGTIAPENADYPFEVRQFIYGRKPHLYRLVFTIEDETVIILHVRHGRRLPLRP